MSEGDPAAASVLRRYWPAVVVVVVVVVIMGVATSRGGDDGQSADSATAATDGTGSDDGDGETSAEDAAAGSGSDIEVWREADPAEAPDCDPETGRIMIPSVYAPNCVPLWPEDADNGGATHRGVSADEIVVAVYDGQTTAAAQGPIDALGTPDLTDEESAVNRDGVVRAHTDLYETYGRTIRWELLEASGGPADEAAARADAIAAAEEIGAFAVIGGPTGTNAFVQELVDRGVLCLCTSSQPVENYQRWSPHVFAGLMASTQAMTHFAEYFDLRLVGQPADFAGDPAFRERERTFGLVYYETADGAYESPNEYFERDLEERGIEFDITISYIYGDGDNLVEDAAAAVTRLKSEGVTTVLFAGDPIMPIHLTREATDQEYHPEWVMSGLTGLDVRGFARQYDQDQWSNAFGLSLLLPPIAPDYVQREGNVVSWHLGEELTSYPDIYDWGRFFQGVHLAGPELDPESFRDGLFSFEPVSGFQTEFGVSYGDDLWPWPDHSGADDVTEIWWDPDALDPTEPAGDVRGMYRYTDAARRYLPGELDQLEGELFDPDGTILHFEERPDGDRPPRYQRRTGRQG